MGANFINVDRQTRMLLPCDMNDWMPEGHIAHFILEAVEQIPIAQFEVNYRGSGSKQYPPTMMLALLIYCYATGRFGSRSIEAATYSDVAVRYICANHHPDHDSICTFRRRNEAAFRSAFTLVLQLAQQMKLTKLGTISIDGTKVQANASKHAAVSYERASEMIAQLDLEVKELMERAQQAQEQESKEALDLPAELQRREDRKAALQKAREVIEERARELAKSKEGEYQEKLAQYKARRAKKKRGGREPGPPSSTPKDNAQYNFTDPESRIMKVNGGEHYEQCYNAQAAVDQAMLIVGQRVSTAANDKQELPQTVAVINPVVAGQVDTVLADSGYYSEAAVKAVETKADGTASGIKVYAAVEKSSHHKTIADLVSGVDSPVPGPEASAFEKMRHRMRTKAGRNLYKLRKQTVEPVFGIIKEVLGFRRFRLRGLKKVSLEWTLICVSYNFKRLFNLKNVAIAG